MESVAQASASAPAIYSISPVVQRLGTGGRLVALSVALSCLAVLITAAFLRPDPKGIGTHTELGLAPCSMLGTTRLPCPSCGMTTSFAWLVRGNLAASLWVQPMGTLLGLAAAMTVWSGLYIAITARPVHRLLRGAPVSYYVMAPLLLAVLAWAWKIFIHLQGIDGWPTSGS
jgi:hypothetical protein